VAQSEVARGPVVADRARSPRRESRVVQAVARAPVRLRTKLLAAFICIAALLVLVGALGLRVLSQSNARVERLGTLQLRATAYRQIGTAATQLRQLLALRAGGSDVYRYLGGNQNAVRPALPSGGSLAFLDATIATTLSQLQPTTNAANLDFVPPPADARVLRQIRADYRRLSDVMARISAFDQAKQPTRGQALQHTQAEPLANELESLAVKLANTTSAETRLVVAENRSAYSSSKTLFTVVGAISVFLSLALGVVLSSTFVRPIQRTDARLAAIAAGDFSGHVRVSNRDELGVLAANVNRMNDELGRLYKELETVSRHKSEFLANMSHELRTPLNAIIGFSEVLESKMAGELNEQQLGYVQDVLEAGRHLLALINDILDLAKVEAGHMQLDLAEVSMRETLRSGLTMYGERAARAGIRLNLELDPDEIVVQADERKVRQVVFNLLSNAVKFTPEGGHIDVSAAMTNGLVEVAVRDSGAGIAVEDQALIFEEFQQARGADASKRQEGTGLGLPLSRKFIEMHGGRLWVESEPGRGSSFRFTLPTRQEAERG
jgi:signal transduction histidine kinase